MSGEGKLQSDSPLESISEDRLGYGGFSKQLAETIKSRTPSDGYTIGIYGQWGSGKSTILNFVEGEIQKNDSNITIVRFNPWWFSGQADLIERFLTQLGTTLESKSTLVDIRDKLSRLSGALSTLPLNALTGVPADQLVESAHQFLDESSGSVNEIKQQIESDLREFNGTIVVVMDDIDRLTPQEVLHMFQIIKSIADFPKVTYLLAFDRSIVVDALEGEGNISDGYLFLDKIVQLPLHIPTQRDGALESLFLDYLAAIPEDYEVNRDRWGLLLHFGIMPILDTPRDVIRLSNTVNVMSASVGMEVDFVDLIGLETLRVFHNDVYHEIRASPQRFLGYRSSGLGPNEEPDDYADILPDDAIQREAVKSILTTLFPNVDDNINNKFSTYGNWNEKRAQRRICHKDRFPVYFRLDIPEGELATHEIGAILSIVEEYDELRSELGRLLDEPGKEQATKASTFIRRVPERMDELPDSGKRNLIRAIFEYGDQMISSQPLNREIDEVRNLVLIIEELLTEQDQDEIDVLKSGISAGHSPYLSAWLLKQYLRATEEDSDSASNIPDWVSKSKIEDLKPAVTESISTAAENGELIEIPSLRYPLQIWEEFGTTSGVDDWVSGRTESDEDLVKFLHKMSAVTIVNMTEPVFYLHPDWLYNYIERDSLEARLETIDVEGVENAGEVVERYDTAVDMMENCEDPSDTENWIFGNRFK